MKTIWDLLCESKVTDSALRNFEQAVRHAQLRGAIHPARRPRSLPWPRVWPHIISLEEEIQQMVAETIEQELFFRTLDLYLRVLKCRIAKSANSRVPLLSPSQIRQPFQQRHYLAESLDPIHIGTGEFQLGRVDNTIVREPGTALPKIPGSSIGGVARAYTAMFYGKYRQAATDQSCAGKGGPKGEKHCGKKELPGLYCFRVLEEYAQLPRSGPVQ